MTHAKQKSIDQLLRAKIWPVFFGGTIVFVFVAGLLFVSLLRDTVTRVSTQLGDQIELAAVNAVYSQSLVDLQSLLERSVTTVVPAHDLSAKARVTVDSRPVAMIETGEFSTWMVETLMREKKLASGESLVVEVSLDYSNLARRLAVIAGILLCLAIGAVLLLGRILTSTIRPITGRITKYSLWMKEIAKNLDKPSLQGSDPGSMNILELATIGNAVSHVSSSVTDYLTALHREESSRVLAQREAVAAQAAARTAQMLAHDVRRPLSTLKTGLDQLRRSTSVEETTNQINRLHHAVESQTAAVDDLIQDILITAGANPASNFAPVDLVSLIRETIDDRCRKRSSQKRINLRLAAPDQVFVIGNERRLSRVFANLLDNAIDSSPTPASLWCVFSMKEQMLCICIGNAGSFISPDRLEQIFLPGYTMDKKEGTGLGLAIVSKVVGEHRGHVRCQSSRSVGTEFFVTLPLPENQSAPMAIRENFFGFADDTTAPPIPTEKHEKSPKNAGNRIVLVDDDPFLLEAWANDLKNFAEVTTFSTAESFLESLKSQAGNPNSLDLSRISLILTDMHFGTGFMDGLELAKKLRAIPACPPIVLVSDALPGTYDPGEFAAAISKVPMPLEQLDVFIKKFGRTL